MRRSATRFIASALAALTLGANALPASACTAMVFKTEDGTGIYARTMEWGASDLHSELALVPRDTAFKSPLGGGVTGAEWKNRYGFVGVNAGGLPFATDGMNEAGLTVGVLFFPGFAAFQEPKADQQGSSVASVDVANYILSNFATVGEVREAMGKIRVVRNAGYREGFWHANPDPPHRHGCDGRVDCHRIRQGRIVDLRQQGRRHDQFA